MAMSMAEMMAKMKAMTPFGESSAPAVVCCVIFFLAGVVAIWNLWVTKYPWYDVVIISCWFRTVSYACKAAYLGGTYRPALGGTSLAFLNAGYGASVAVIGLGLSWWYKNKPYKIFSAGVEAAFFWSSIFLCFAVIAFGPITGVVAAGLIYGDYKSAGVAAAGERARTAATYGLLASNAMVNVLVAATAIRVFTFRPEGKGSVGSAESRSRKNPKLVVLFLVPGILLMVRGCAGVAALYKEYVWETDHFFYLLDTLPEMMAILVFIWPYLLARIASCYPRDEETSKEGKHGTDGDTAEANVQERFAV